MKSAARRRPSRYTYALVLTSIAPSTVTFRFADLDEGHGHRVLRVCEGHQGRPGPAAARGRPGHRPGGRIPLARPFGCHETKLLDTDLVDKLDYMPDGGA
jgi:hypothetical protein